MRLNNQVIIIEDLYLQTFFHTRGIAFAALNRGYKVVFVVPTKFSEEKQTLMSALGAEIIHIPREKGMLVAAQQ